MKRGLFIAFEGGEGAGKTTAMHAVAASVGADILLTREPGGTPEGLALRALLLSSDGPHWDPAAELLLMVAARVQHVRRVIQPALQAGRIVLCDRFVGSTLAYQGAGRGLSPALIMDLHTRAVGGLMPDLTVLLDVDPLLGLRRSVRRLEEASVDEARFEALDVAFHERVRADFLDQAKTCETIIVDAGQAQAEVIACVVDRVGAKLTELQGKAGV